MNILNKSTLILLVFTLFVVSCSKDENPAAPTISNLEVGKNNSKIGIIGQELHLEADILAPGKIKTIKIDIHSESHHGGWEFSKTYTEYDGLINTNFHHDIHIPLSATPGEYHFEFIVIDQNGRTTEKEVELKIEEAAKDAPQISNLDAHVENNGNDLHVTAKITALHKIDKIVIELEGAIEELFTFDSMRGKEQHDFSEHIDISKFPKGHYHVHFSVRDLQGNEVETEIHFDK